MKKKLLVLAVVLFASDLFSQVGLEGIIVEKFYVSDAADSVDASDNFSIYPLHIGSVTYRVYADLLPGYKVIQFYGSPTHPMNIETTTSFYNDPNYGVSIYQGTSLTNTKKHTTLIDSYLTVGGVASGLMGVLKTEDTDGTIGNLQGILANSDPSAGLPITGVTGADGLMPGTPVVPNILGLSTELEIFDQTLGGVFNTTGGTVAALGGVAGVTDANHVLLGQFTTDGTFSFKLNLQIATPNPGESQNFVANDPTGNEIYDSTLTYTSPEVIDGILEADAKRNTEFEIFPNPCHTFLNVTKSGKLVDRTSIQIFDVAGRNVYSSSFASSCRQLDLTELTSGVYTVVLANGNDTQTVRVIKQ